jgi:hypothetical protein
VQPNFGVRLSPKAPADFFRRAIDYTIDGVLLHLFNDEVIIPGQERRGVTAPIEATFFSFFEVETDEGITGIVAKMPKTVVLKAAKGKLVASFRSKVSLESKHASIPATAGSKTSPTAFTFDRPRLSRMVRNLRWISLMPSLYSAKARLSILSLQV